MREYRIKRGHNADINALLTEYFGVKGDVLTGVEFEVPSIGKIMMRREIRMSAIVGFIAGLCLAEVSSRG